MRSWAGLIVEGGAHVPRLCSFHQKFHDFLASRNHFFCDSFNVHPFACIFPQLQICIIFIEQVDNLLVVDLKKGTADDEVYTFSTLFVDAIK